MPTPPNASQAEIIALLREGHSNARIARDLRVDKHRVRRIRAELGLPQYVPVEQTRTIEQKWALFTRPVEGGHLEWTGTRGTSSGTPVLAYKEQLYTAASIAFRIKAGRDPEGYAIPGCDFKNCVAPDHVEDEAGRCRIRLESRVRNGLGDLPERCAYGHDMAEHGKLEEDGTAYCGLCKTLDKQERRDPSLPRRTRQPKALVIREDIAELLRAGVPLIHICKQLHTAPITVQRTREALGLPTTKPGPKPPASWEEAFHRKATPTADGHVAWTGRMHDGTPIATISERARSAYRIAFELHHGREPVGWVKPGCGTPVCVAGAHLEDRPTRAANRRADAAFEAIFGEAS